MRLARSPPPDANLRPICWSSRRRRRLVRPLGNFESLSAKHGFGSRLALRGGREIRQVVEEIGAALLDEAACATLWLRGWRLGAAMGDRRSRRPARPAEGRFGPTPLGFQLRHVVEVFRNFRMISPRAPFH